MPKFDEMKIVIDGVMLDVEYIERDAEPVIVAIKVRGVDIMNLMMQHLSTVKELVNVERQK
jgi:phosphoribosyl 1,2-cyclic phosphodiesterase